MGLMQFPGANGQMTPQEPVDNPFESMQQSINLNITEDKIIRCKDCERATFIPAFHMARISPLEFPGISEVQCAPIQTFICNKCGRDPKEVMKEFESLR